MPVLPIPAGDDYGFVIVVVASTFVNSLWHGLRVGQYRKNAGIAYPNAYADTGAMSAASGEKKQAMYLFNCAQRAHSNFLEHQTTVLTAILITGLQYPIASAALGALWNVGRVLYAVGYTRADKQGGSGRHIGAPYYIGEVGLYGLTFWTGIKMTLAAIEAKRSWL